MNKFLDKLRSLIASVKKNIVGEPQDDTLRYFKVGENSTFTATNSSAIVDFYLSKGYIEISAEEFREGTK
jgi:hypothetical protein